MYKYAAHEWFWVLHMIASATEDTAVVVATAEESRALMVYAMKHRSENSPLFWIPYPGVGRLVGFDFPRVILDRSYEAIRSNCRDWFANEILPSLTADATIFGWPG